jgi:hypothetical protein
VPKPVVEVRDAKIGFLGYGTALGDSASQLREEMDVKTRTTGCGRIPFTDDLVKFIDAHERVCDRAEPRRAAAAAS